VTIVLYRLRTEARRHWAAWLVVAALVAVGSGAVMAGIAGIRRADTVAERLADASNRSDAFTDSGYFYKARLNTRKIAELPQVATNARHKYMVVEGRTKSGAPIWPDESPDALTVYEQVGPPVWRSHDRPVVVSGRLPNPRSPNEVVVDAAAARILGVGVGDSFDLRFATRQFMGRLDHVTKKPFAFRHNPLTYPSGPLERLRVVGVAAGLDPGRITLSPGFYRRYDRGRLQAWVKEDAYALHGGADAVPGFQARVDALARGGFDFFYGADDTASVQAAVDFQTRMVSAVVIAGALAVLALIVTLLARQTAAESRDWSLLRAVGVRRGQLVGLSASRGLLVGLVAAPPAVAVAVALSPLFPLGNAHVLEPSPGISVDPAVMLAGALTLMGLCPVVAALVAWRISYRHAATERAAGDSRGFGIRLGRLPLTAFAGLRGALDRGASARISTASTLVAAIVAVTAVSAALVVSASLAHLLANPPLYGQNWDLELGEGGSAQVPTADWLQSNRVVTGFAKGATSISLQIEGAPVGVQAMSPGRGRVTPTVARGRAPEHANEILLARQTMADLHARIGSWVTARRGPLSQRFRVVGEGLLPPSSDNGLGDGAAVTLLGLKALLPHAFASLFRVRLAPGTNIEAWLRQLERDTHMVAFPPVPPPDVADTGRRRVIPYSIAAIAGVVAVVALAHALLTSVRERRELAILKTVGFVRSQLVMTVIWQGAAVGVIALLVGLPLGVAAGRWVWTFVTGYLGVLEVTVVPSLQVIAVIPAVLIAVVLVAAWPGRTAAHTRAARALRAE
jgi:hypothetical protein